MIAAYRIVKTRWAAFAFDGEGARRSGGRWNSIGTRMVYAAESRALAALEVLVHLEGPAQGYSVVACEFPEAFVETITVGILPADWRTAPAPAALAALGNTWIMRRSSAVLSVPSALVDGERNYLLNPEHPDFPRVLVYPPEPFPYDARLIARRDSVNA